MCETVFSVVHDYILKTSTGVALLKSECHIMHDKYLGDFLKVVSGFIYLNLMQMETNCFKTHDVLSSS